MAEDGPEPEGEPLDEEKPAVLTRISLGIAGAAGGFVVYAAALALVTAGLTPFASPGREFEMPGLVATGWTAVTLAVLFAAWLLFRRTKSSILRGGWIGAGLAAGLSLLLVGLCGGFLI